ncbi:AraC family transcriptional regulator [Cohnella hongkongensis]|uniref:AraC family transcriptional regulator n=1 Tax=Cohnella hongkongensis TaxID=178337 RepID=A0ABV9FGX7_9BACL
MRTVLSRYAPLEYKGACELPIAGEERLKVAADGCDRFGICLQADLLAALDGPGGRPTRIAAGELFHLPAGRASTLQSPAFSSATLLLVSFSGLAAKRSSGSSSAAAGIRSFRFPQMKNWMSEFAGTAADRLSESDYYLAQSRLYAMAAAYLNASATPIRDETALYDDLEKARRRIRDHYDAALDMEELARSSGVGSSRFYKLFRQMTGLSPLKYLITRRLAASLRLLADPNVSVTEAAHSVGYPDEYYFSRLFKKQMGITPTEYALRSQVSVAALCGIYRGDLAALGMTARMTLKRDWELDLANRDRYLREIREARPDFILAGPLPDDLVAELRTIAPLTVYRWHEHSWKTRFADFARLLGLESVAQRWLSDFESKTDNARRHVEERLIDKPFLIVGVRAGNFRVYGKQRRKFTDLLYDELRFQSPAAADDIGFLDLPDVQDVMELDSEHVLFLIEFPADDAFCSELERQWRSKPGRAGVERSCLFIRLEEPFLYNAEMHERLVDQIVDYLFAHRREK